MAMSRLDAKSPIPPATRGTFVAVALFFFSVALMAAAARAAGARLGNSGCWAAWVFARLTFDGGLATFSDGA
jgi:hypothetical protein